MATKNYMINDKWLDLDKQNIVELQSVDGVLDSLKVNGSEIETPSGKITITENGTDIDVAQYALADVNVEGGGGSSDFSTAQVTVVNNSQSDAFNFVMCVTMTNEGVSATTGLVLGTPVGETEVFNVVLYKGNAHIQFEASDEEPSVVITTSGNISDLGGDNYMVTGDCTITIS